MIEFHPNTYKQAIFQALRTQFIQSTAGQLSEMVKSTIIPLNTWRVHEITENKWNKTEKTHFNFKKPTY